MTPRETIERYQVDDIEVWRASKSQKLLPEDFQPFLTDSPPVEPLKDSHSRQTYCWRRADREVYVKVFLFPGPDRWRDLFRRYIDLRHRARNQFENLHRLYRGGYNVAAPLLALEKKKSLFKRVGLVAYESLDAPRLTSAVESGLVNPEEAYRRGLQFLQKLHSEDAAFGDTKLDNQLYRDGEIYWVDYDDLKLDYQWPPSKLRDLRRYICSWHKYLPDRDLDWFRHVFSREYSLHPWLEKFLFYRIEGHLSQKQEKQ